MRPRGLSSFIVIALISALPVSASTASICDSAAIQASSETGVPAQVLRSITRTETGRGRSGGLQPWPWTVNMEGKGHWFDSEEAARSFVEQEYRRGARSFDVGCFQINYKYHGDAFQSIDQMFDPLENARYAARFLSSLYAETGDWSHAAGAYHSRTPEYAQRYRLRFDRIRAAIDDQSADLPHLADLNVAANSVVRENLYPLLRQSDGLLSNGSLVPLPSSGNARPIIMATHKNDM